jgi:hypothetical protein
MIARTEHDAKERQLLSLKLAARLNRLQQAGTDSDAKYRSPSPPSDLPASPAACPMSDQEMDGAVLIKEVHQKVISEGEIPDSKVSGTAEAVNIGGTEALSSAEETSAGSVRYRDKAATEHRIFAPALDAPAKRHPSGSNSSSARPSQPSPKLRSKPSAEAHPAAASLEQCAKPDDGPRPKAADDVGRAADSAEASGGNRRPPSTSKKASGDAGRADAVEEQGGVPATISR